jgi:peptidoglycan/LPS O-acetylase OafA/YrhL
MIEIHWSPDARRLRSWGLVAPVAFAAAGALMWFVSWGPFPHLKPMAPVLWSLGALALVTAGFGMPGGLWLYRAWMGVAWCIGTALGVVALAIVYAFVVTPIGVVARVAGWDPLDARMDGRSSRWHALPGARHDPERQF